MNQVPGLTSRNRNPLSISVVAPCYNEAEVLTELHRRLSAVLQGLDIPYEIVLVDDGSRDKTWLMMQELQGKDQHLKIVRLARNFGHQIALTCGLDQASAEVILIIDADLQDPPELLGEMLAKWKEGYDVVYGKRLERHGEPLLKRFFAFMFYRIFEKICGINIPRDTGDFRLMDRRALAALQSLREKHRFIRGMVSWIGYQQCAVEYERPQRFAGETKYPFKKSLFLAMNAIVSFSYAPLRLASYLGVLFSALAFAYIVIVVILKFVGISYSGYTSIMASILLLGGVQLIVLGILGEYVGRIFEQGQNRPIYLIDRIFGEPLEKK